MTEDNRPKLLFLCTGNSCRSQMAEGFVKHYKSDKIAVYSAGVERHGLNPHAVRVMQEVGVDISKHHSKLLAELAGVEFDYVITVCDDARESCPLFPGSTTLLHQAFDDPPRLAEAAQNDEEKLKCYRKVRDDIKTYILTLPQSLLKNLEKES